MTDHTTIVDDTASPVSDLADKAGNPRSVIPHWTAAQQRAFAVKVWEEMLPGFRNVHLSDAGVHATVAAIMKFDDELLRFILVRYDPDVSGYVNLKNTNEKAKTKFRAMDAEQALRDVLGCPVVQFGVDHVAEGFTLRLRRWDEDATDPADVEG